MLPHSIPLHFVRNPLACLVSSHSIIQKMSPSCTLIFILLYQVSGVESFYATSAKEAYSHRLSRSIVSNDFLNEGLKTHSYSRRAYGSCAFTFQHALIRTSTKCPTAMRMGLRSFIKKIIRSDGSEEPSEFSYESKKKPEDVKAALEAIKADLEAVVSLQEGSQNDRQMNKERTIDSEFDSRSPNDALDPTKTTPQMRYSETVQERILRVKSGMMTEDEKASFLNNALTRPLPTADGKVRPPPIRQSIPESSAPVSSDPQQILSKAIGTFRRNKNSSSTNAPSSSPSPVPTDSIWKNVIAKSPSSNQASYPIKSNINPSSKGDLDDAAKRSYFNLVMNPERFKSYAAMGGSRTPAAPGLKSQDEYAAPMDTESFKETLSYDESPPSYNLGLTATKTIESSSTTTPSQKVDKNDLAYRLEIAATLKEQRDAEIKAKRESDRMAATAAALTAQETRDAEIRRQQEAALEKKRMEKERKEREEMERRAEADRKMQEMIERQEQYWKNKVKKESLSKPIDEPLPIMNDASDVELYSKEEDREEAHQQSHGMHMIDTSNMSDTEIEKWRKMEMEKEDPHEQEILKEVSLFGLFVKL